MGSFLAYQKKMPNKTNLNKQIKEGAEGVEDLCGAVINLAAIISLGGVVLFDLSLGAPGTIFTLAGGPFMFRTFKRTLMKKNGDEKTKTNNNER